MFFSVVLKAEAATQRNSGAAVSLLSVATFSLRFSNSYKLDGDKVKRLAGVILLPPPPPNHHHSLLSALCFCMCLQYERLWKLANDKSSWKNV